MVRFLKSQMVILSAALILSTPSNADSPRPEDFIRETSARVSSSLGKNGISDEERERRFRELLNETFDVPYITRFVLGRYWRVMTEAEKSEFSELFSNFLVRTYANRFRNFSDGGFTIRKSRKISSRETIVLSSVQMQDQPPIDVEWRVRNQDRGFRISDVVVEGLSLSVTQRDEFSSVIRRSGGKVDGLIRALRRQASR